MSGKIKFALYLTSETREKLERWYTADGSRSKTDFIEKAINFYVASLAVNDTGALLPAAITSAIEGRLGMFEDRLATLLFKQTVEHSMMMNIIAADTNIDEVLLNKLRGKCVDAVKRTNGRISFGDILKYQKSV
jgi:hypothetical protein